MVHYDQGGIKVTFINEYSNFNENFVTAKIYNYIIIFSLHGYYNYGYFSFQVGKVYKGKNCTLNFS